MGSGDGVARDARREVGLVLNRGAALVTRHPLQAFVEGGPDPPTAEIGKHRHRRPAFTGIDGQREVSSRDDPTVDFRD